MTRTERSPRTLARRLLPLQIGVGLQGFMLWVPVEKLFMFQIGFDAALVGVMAAAYAAVVPLLEVPSGILADRRSRSWLLAVASLCLAASCLLGGLSHDVVTYVLAAMILGAFLALNSGTVDSIVYDTVLEETGASTLYERWIGRVRVVESVALVASGLLGGLLAGWTSPRAMYYASVPFALASLICFVVFREPRLHRAAEPTRLGQHVALTFRVMLRDPRVRRLMLLTAGAATLSQAIFEFGPLWLVTLHAPAAAFGPQWALLVGTLGVAGLLTAKLPLDRRPTALVVAALLAVVPVVLVISHSLVLVVAAQVLLALTLTVLGIHGGALVHDAVESTIRAGVSSGVGTLSWLLFLPFSLAIGAVAKAYGQLMSGWLLLGAGILVGVLLVVATFRPHRVDPAEEPPELAPAVSPPPDDLACRQLVQVATRYLDGELPPDWRDSIEDHLSDCDGCTTYLAQLRQVVGLLEQINVRQQAP